MKKVIYKYQLAYGKNSVGMPKGAEILTAQLQDDKIMLWALCDHDVQTMEERVFEVLFTGQPFNESSVLRRKYISTVMTTSGAIVYHIFAMESMSQSKK